ncbi:MAG TPA: hypothetical protein IAB37_01480 [Candidatus Faecivivens stercoravium]|uniref:Integral membrane protein n=1 Tax=Candidatus Faecivivens stercoravium TaxID=2840803 RepID=A0A9D1J4L6_9FIRM|nr:hypothetical protein [Candidatus Faecivivens stercoravium]
MVWRFLLYLVGLNLIALAVVLNIRYDLGVAAFSSVMYAISEIYSISLGTASIICYLIFVVVQCILSRKITLQYLLEVPLSFAFGLLTDFYDWLIPAFSLALALRVIFFALTMFVTAMGVFLCVKTNLVLTPTDGIVKTIADVFLLPFSATKNVFDLSLVAISVLLCLVNHAPFYGIGVGTVLTAVFIGRIIKVYEKFVPLPEGVG